MAQNDYELGDGSDGEEDADECYLDLSRYAEWNIVPSSTYVSDT